MLSVGISASAFDQVAALRSESVFWIDAANSAYAGGQTVPNQGSGGSALDATLGSTSGADSNDPQWLPYAGTAYCYLPGVGQNALSVPDAAGLRITGDLDLRVKVALDDWTPTSDQVLLSKWTASTNQRAYALRIDTAGTVNLLLSQLGTAVTGCASTVATGLTDGTVKWVRATYRASDQRVQFFLSDDGSSWTQLGADVTHGVTAIFGGTAQVEVGSLNSLGGNNAAGKFYRAQILNGIGGTTVLDVDTSILTSGAATSFACTTGQTCTINRGTSGRKSAVVTENKWLLGTDDYMEVPSNSLLNFTASDSFTVLAVVRQWATVANFVRYVSKYAGSGAGWELLTNGSGGLQTDIYDGTNSASRNNGTITAGALSVIGVKGDRTGNTFGILNGTTAFTTTGFGSVADLSNAQPMRIGVRSGTAVQYGAFELVAVAVFRSALSAAQITALSTYFTARNP